MILRKTKIIATLGPASQDHEIIEQLHLAGVNGFRLNFSHGHHSWHGKMIDMIRQIEENLERPIAVIADLQGPKLRVGKFIDGYVELNKGEKFILDNKQELGTKHRVFISHPELFDVVTTGMKILLDDGRIIVKVISNSRDEIITEVLTGGAISDNKGLNIPHVAIPIPALTAKDKEDLAFAMNYDIDWVMLSFVQNKHDVLKVREIIGDRKIKIMVKIEKPAAIDNLEDIISVSDCVCVARGDLALETDYEMVPILQKKIIESCRNLGCPVIIATQMLDSMMKNPTPTRAEVSDVAGAVFDLSDGVMLTNETAVGKWPLAAVGMLTKIIHKVENDGLYNEVIHRSRVKYQSTNINVAIATAARRIVDTISAKAIVSFSASGKTGLYISRERPYSHIVVLTSNIHAARALSFVWGIYPIIVKGITDFDDMVRNSKDILLDLGLFKNNEHIVVTGSENIGVEGSTDTLRIIEI